jgi:thiamine biosynthesis protein ThiI
MGGWSMVSILIRLGELTLKSSRSRKRFMRILVRNIKDAIISSGISDFKIENLWSRLLVHLPDFKEVPSALLRVFGIVSLSPVYMFRFDDFNEIIDEGEKYFKDIVINKTFAVRARRSGSHKFTSMDISKELGDRLYKYSKGVDLRSPEVEVFVEIRDNICFLYKEVIPAYGGLPIGTEGKVVSLISGGFDSAVASWYMLRRGAEVHYLFLNLGDESYLNNVVNVVRVLCENWSYGYEPEFHVVPGRDIMVEIMKTREDYWNVILKRVLYRLAEKLAEELNADSIVTGESLGQVSSQTLRNLRVSQMAISIPVNRPLFGFDKEDIIRVSRNIGTYEFSSKVREYCALVPRKPILNADPGVVIEEEAKIDFDKVYEAYDNRKILYLKKLFIKI